MFEDLEVFGQDGRDRFVLLQNTNCAIVESQQRVPVDQRAQRRVWRRIGRVQDEHIAELPTPQVSRLLSHPVHNTHACAVPKMLVTIHRRGTLSKQVVLRTAAFTQILAPRSCASLRYGTVFPNDTS